MNYKTMINWASLVLLLFSVVILTTQSNCVRAAPGLFYLVLVLSLLGYACLAILVFLWLVVMFCLNGLVFLLEIFGVGPTVMQWQGATPEMIDAIPIVKFTNGHRHPSSLDERTTPDEHDNEEQEEIDEKGAGGATAGAAAGAIVATSAFTPAIVVSSLDEGSISGEETGSGGKAEGFVIDIQILESGHNNNDNRTSFEGGSSAANVKTLVTTPNSVESHAFHNIASIATSPFSRTQDEEALALEDLDQEGHQHSSPKQKQQQRRQQQQPQQIENDQTQAGNHNNRISTACPICLCDYEDLEELRHLPCDHFFHKECVDEWLKLKRTCPLCKRDITVHNSDQNEVASGSSADILHRTANMQEHAPLSSAWTEVELAVDDDEDDEHEGNNQQREQTHVLEITSMDRIEDLNERSTTTNLGPPSSSASSIRYHSGKSRLKLILRSVSIPFSASRISSASTSMYSLVQPESGSNLGELDSQFPSSVLTRSSLGSSASSGSGSTGIRVTPSRPTDGVFANLSAKPEVDGAIESNQRPPAYESAVQDVTPPYFEMTVITPNVCGDEILIDGIPVGNIYQFFWNTIVSAGFQFLGALLTYLLHNSHASKTGSMVGLGLTLVNFGVQMRGGFGNVFGYYDATVPTDTSSTVGEVTQVDKPPLYVDDTGYIGGDKLAEIYGSTADSAQMDWLQINMESHFVSLLLMLAGWIIIIRSVAQYSRAKRTEKIIRALPMEERPGQRDTDDRRPSFEIPTNL
ncbi:hypothetical protein BGZ83_008913 [Gryganskiella cystojenkinii]|nr:hypothetical protein BGZ83_008913 [Gryganskiella cystojenkinii]